MKGLWNALEKRLPIRSFLRKHILHYQVPQSLNAWYVFGLLAIIFLVNQYISGIWLTMFYTPTVTHAFSSVQSIMRDVPSGWFIRYLHTTGASFLFIVLYLHMIRSFLYGSYHKPRELVWIVGVSLLLIMYVQAFLGYVLPWGQMSYWGAEVVTSALQVMPWLMQWVRGASEVGGPLLQRFFALHIIVFPLLILYIIKLHIIAIRHVGSSTPVNDKGPVKTIRFFPDHVLKELFFVVIWVSLFFGILFFWPELGGIFIEPLNAVPANPLVTPSAIHPPWYITPYFAILRSIPNLLLGVILTSGAVLAWFFVPAFDKSQKRLLSEKSWLFKAMMLLLLIDFIGLGILGWFELNIYTLWLSRLCTLVYFFVFLAMPIYSRGQD